MLAIRWIDFIIADAVPSNEVMNAGRALQKMYIIILIIWTRDGENIYAEQHNAIFW